MKEPEKILLETIFTGILDERIEIAFSNAIAYKFPEYTHMIITRYSNGELLVIFLDPLADYVPTVTDYIHELKKQFSKP